MKTKLYHFFLLFSLIAANAIAQCPTNYGPNLVVNGDFSSGNSGFGTDYTTSPQGCVLSFAKTFLVTASPCNFEITGDHTSSSGSALYVNGDANDADAAGAGQNDPAYASQRVWYQTVIVTPNTDYSLSAWMANATDQAHCSCGGPAMAGKYAQLNFYVNGVQVGSTFTLSGFGTWMQFTGTWNSGLATSAVISITDVNDAYWWNDFGLDDISFRKATPVTLDVTPRVTDVRCFGGNDGSIALLVRPTSPVIVSPTPLSYTYSWTPSGSGNPAHGLSAGTYSVTVTDSHGCTGSTTATVNQPASAISVSIKIGRQVTCHGGSDGMLMADASGGTGTLHYSWSPSGGSDVTASGLSAGTYTVTVTDDNGCTGSATVTLTDPSALSLTPFIFDALCNGGIGFINVEASGGTPFYTYSWSTGGVGFALFNDFFGPAGTYSVTARDLRGCEVSGSYTIAEPAAINITASATNVRCNGGDNGAINTHVNGGTAPYRYIWSNGAHSADLTGLSAGTYNLVVVDAHGCSSTATFTITQPSAITLSSHVDNILCHGGFGGHISVEASGGTPFYSYHWSGPGFAWYNNVFGFAGTYHVMVTDTHGCTAAGTYEITEPSAIHISAVASNATCHGEHNGSINTTVIGGTAPYHYHWSNGSHHSDLSGLSAGNYHLEVTDAHGCSSGAEFTISEPSRIEISGTTANVSCHGGNNGHINTTVTGGVPGYHYFWSNGSHVADPSGLSAGTYHLVVIDGHGCHAEANYTITEPSSISITATTANVTCHDGHNGHISVSVTGGTPGYTYSWRHGCGTANPFDLSAGTYYLTVTDAHGCTATATYTITEPSAIHITADVDNVRGCHGEHNGHINTTVTGGTPGYSYSWSNGCHEADPSHLGAGTYNLTVTDAHGCTANATYTVTEPAAISISGIVADASCHGEHNGHINTTVTGGVWPYHYFWSNGAHSADVAHLGAGIYHLVVIDAHGCHATATYNVTEPSTLSVSATVAEVSCNHGDNGSINTTVTGGTAGYNYLWSNGSHAADPSGLSAGTYFLLVTDAHGCHTGSAYRVTEPSAIHITADVDNVRGCHGEHNGHIHVSVTGGTPGYSYEWSHGCHEADPSHLGAGTYTLTVTDAHGCHATATYTITEPSAISITATTSNVSCHGEHNGRINTTVTGGVRGYHYSWSNGSHEADPSHLGAGTYHLEVTDAHGCHATASYTITEPAHIDISAAVANVNCHGEHNGSINTTVTGGTSPYHYYWSNGSHSADISGLCIGTYHLVVTDAHGCHSAAVYTITQPSPISITATTTNVSCHGGNNGHITTSVTGGTPGYTYSWRHGCGTANPSDLSAGTYYLTVTDAHGCTATATYTITEPSAIHITADVDNVRGCHGEHNGHINTTVTGGTPGYSYSWSNGCHEADPSHLGAGTYSLTVTDAHGCTANATYTVTEPAAISISGIVADASCHGEHNGHINTTVTGGAWPYHYFWSNGAHSADVARLGAGIYHLVVIDAHGCHATATYNVTEPSTLSVSATVAEVSCNHGDNGSVNTTVTGGTAGYNYLWSNGSHAADPSGLSAGTYFLLVTDAHGCHTGGAYRVTEPSAIHITADVDNVRGCHGEHNGHIHVSVTGGTPGYSYEWSHGCHEADPSHLGAGTYTLTVTDAHGCHATATYTITEPAAIVISADVDNVRGCHGEHNGHIRATVTGGAWPYHYSWSNGSHEAEAHHLAAGTYHLTVTDAHGCTATASYTVTEPASIEISGAVANVSCYGDHNGRINTTVTGGTSPFRYHWSNGACTADLSGLCPGTYHLVVTDAHGCHANAVYSITQPSPISITATTTNVSCHGGNNGRIIVSVTGGTPGYTYSWRHGCGTANPSDLSAGTYYLTVTDAHGCTATATYTITEPSAIHITADVDIVRGCHGDHNGHIHVNVTGGTPGYSYSWSHGCHEADPSHLGAGTYNLTVTDDHGCTANAAYTITEPSAIEISADVHNASGCHGEHNGHINVTVTGGTPGYHYEWSHGCHEAHPWHLGAGVYHLTVTDANGCTASATYTVTADAPMAVTGVATDVTCHGDHNGHINTTVTGGTPVYHYEWSHGCHEADPSGLSAGTYNVTVTDSRGCSADAAFTINEPYAISISAGVANVSCHGGNTGRISVQVSGGTPGYTYSWSNGSHDACLSGLAAGTYVLTVTDSHGCTATTTYIVTEPAALTLTATTTDVTCHGCNDGRINTTVTGGTPCYTYSWSNGARTADICGLYVGCYGVTVTDANGCTAEGKYVISETHCLSRSAASGDTTNTTAGVAAQSGTSADAIRVYPNPTTGIFNVVIPTIHKDAEIVISDVAGKVIDRKSVANNTGDAYQFSLNNVVSGIYFVKVYADDVTYVEKVMLR